ncbi:MAG TPA: hypothetical protein VEI97_05160 [bacterium]|nr:hypothetical protein [bacterium]
MLEGPYQAKIEQVIAWLEEAVDANNDQLVERLHTVLTRMVGLIPGGGIIDPAFIETLDLIALQREVDKGLAPAASQGELLGALEQALDRPDPVAEDIYGAFRALLLKLAHDQTDRLYTRSQDG